MDYYSGGHTDGQVWYKVTTTEPGILIVDIVAEEGLQISARLFDTNKTTTLHYDEDGTSSERRLTREDLNPGTFYVCISRSMGFGRYTVHSFVAAHPSYSGQRLAQTVEDGRWLGIDSVQSGLLGYVGAGLNYSQSWYRLEQRNEGPLVLYVITAPTLTILTRLFDGATTVAVDEGGPRFIRGILLDPLSAGVYDLRVNRSRGYGSYYVVASPGTQ